MFFRRRLARTGKPPLVPQLKQLFRAASDLSILRTALDFVIPPEYEHGCPMALVSDLLDFQADSRVLAHPLDLLTEHGEGVQAASLGVERKMNGDDVGLVEKGAAESSYGTSTH